MSPTGLLLLFGMMIALASFSNWARLLLLSMTPPRFKELFGRGKEDQDEAWPKDAERMLLSFLVGANTAKVTAPLILFAWLDRAAPQLAIGWKLIIALLTSTAFLLLFAEALPRMLLSSRHHPTLRLAVAPLLLLNWIASPARVILQQASFLIGKLFGQDASNLTFWPLHSSGSGAWGAEGKHVQLEENEKVLISSIYNMTETIVREVMVPRVDMHCVEENFTLHSVRPQILQTGHSRFPVYSGNIDNIVGLFLAKNLLQYSSHEKLSNITVKHVMHPMTFVPETKNISHLLREFQQKRQHMAVVVDEYGNTAGLVTIEDLLEEIVGEIEDEFDREQKLFAETKDGGYIVNAKMSISDLVEELSIQIPDNSEYDTIGGFVVATLGKVPQQGETFLSNGVVVTVLDADDRRVRRVKLVPSSQQKESDQSRDGSGELQKLAEK